MHQIPLIVGPFPKLSACTAFQHNSPNTPQFKKVSPSVPNPHVLGTTELLVSVVSSWNCNSVLTNSMQHTPSWEANSSSASQETPRSIWSPKVHYRIHKSQLPLPILNQINQVHSPIPLPEDPF